MTAATASLAPDQSSATAFNAWASGVSTMLASAGWVKNTDTGQITFPVTTSPATNQNAGYEIYKLNDSLQTSNPVFLKIEYGTGASANYWHVWVTIGKGTDGAGAISAGNTLIGRTEFGYIQDATSYLCSASTDTSGWTMMLFGGYRGNAGFVLAVERTRNADQTINADGLVVNFGGYVNGTSISYFSAVYNFVTVAVTGGGGQYPPFAFGLHSTGVVGTDVQFFPLQVTLPKVEGTPLSVLGYGNGDVTDRTVISIPVNGVNHSYMPSGLSGLAGTDVSQSANRKMAIRHE